MASSSSQKPSSSSAPTGKFNFDVFLSFRGEDTRHNFSDHLFENLKRMGIKTFRDDKLERGEEIAQELLGAIEGSKISIIVFSERYADSKWCLEELTKIMECRKQMDQMVVPVFYHVNPSDVRKQSRSFGEAFAKHEKNEDKEKVRRWKAAMTEAGSLSGWHVIKDYGYESKYIEEILEFICKRLGPKLLDVDDDIVGMDSHLGKLKSLINSQSHDVCVVGLYGTGGIGKTTLAKFAYNEIQCKFNGASFLENVKERFKKGYQLQLQQELLHGIVGQKIELSNINDGINLIKDRLGSEKVLIVIDDVDCMEQLKPLARSRNWFGARSTIILTTRDQQLLRNYGANVTYEVKKLDDVEAIQLFSKHAFKQKAPKQGYVDLSICVADYAQGLPLALKVLGSSLYGMESHEWKSALEKLKDNPKQEINDVLRTSYDMLDCSGKKVFLDIACFFEGEDKEFVSKILDSCNLYATYNIRVLYDKCLITISNNRIRMHSLIAQMGWAIVREDYPEDPSKWSRLWDPNDIYDAFSRQKGMKNIETIYLDLSRFKKLQFTPEVLAEMKRVFSKMEKLRLLKVYYSNHYNPLRKKNKMCLPRDFEFPSNLRYLHWEGLKSLPSNFHGENLVAINLKHSNIKELWEGDKCLAKLKFIDLSNSKQLIKMPKFSNMPNLERLKLEGCTSLCQLHSSIGAFPKMKFLRELNISGSRIKEVPSSIGSFKSLEILNLSKCSKFEKFPDIVFVNMEYLRRLELSESGIKELPNSIRYLESLESLNLSGCSNFEKFPEIQGNMKNLKRLSLDKTAIKELPNSIGYLESLESLNLSCCSNFEKFPEIQGNMKHLKLLFLRKTAIKELPNSIGYLESLETLDLSCCSNFEKFPEIQGSMKHLKMLSLSKTAIKELPNSIESLEALKFLCLRGCSNFEKFPEIQKNMENLSFLHLNESAITELSYSMGHLPQLQDLNLGNCKNLTSIQSNISKLKSLKHCSLNGCSNLEAFPEIIEDMEHLKHLYLRGTAIRELPSSIGRLRGLTWLELSNCENLVSLPNGIGNLTCLHTLFVHNCPRLHKLPDNLRSLQRCLRNLDVSGCNLMEGAIPSDLWRLFSLGSLNVSENNIRRIPPSIIHLAQLHTLRMNHCPMLEEIPKLPSSLRRIEAHGCPHLEALPSDPTHLLWSSLLNCVKSKIQDFRCKRDPNFLCPPEITIVIPGRSGIPKWISCKTKGCEATINLPKNWYEDDRFLGFALFFQHLPLDNDDECEARYSLMDLEGTTHGQFTNYTISHCQLSISHGERFKRLDAVVFMGNCKMYTAGGPANEFHSFDTSSRSSTDPALLIAYFPQTVISSKYRSSRWNKFKARFEGNFLCGDKAAFKAESCGIDLIYDDVQNHHQQNENQGIHDGEPSGSRCSNIDGLESENSDYYSANEGEPTADY